MLETMASFYFPPKGVCLHLWFAPHVVPWTTTGIKERNVYHLFHVVRLKTSLTFRFKIFSNQSALESLAVSIVTACLRIHRHEDVFQGVKTGLVMDLVSD